jgi:hypothetical protein
VPPSSRLVPSSASTSRGAPPKRCATEVMHEMRTFRRAEWSTPRGAAGYLNLGLQARLAVVRESRCLALQDDGRSPQAR